MSEEIEAGALPESLPCPKCGGKGRVWLHTTLWTARAVVRCDKCRHEVKSPLWAHDTRSEAEDARWREFVNRAVERRAVDMWNEEGSK
ncbi:MAG: hypothetical protein Q4B35_06555 [Slackia sp.]|nr:hypothetical protein [Slackia sp.]